MFERIVDVPRLSATEWAGRLPALDEMARGLGERYGVALPAISANLYRDGRDSVAWHGDRIGRVRSDAVVAILSLGSDRTLLLRPNGGGASISFTMRSGDLVVQGGTCQRTFEHCVPKRADAGPRISVMFRQRGGN
jgi:alkylated DNA repair dioxygenase AlkB